MFNNFVGLALKGLTIFSEKMFGRVPNAPLLNVSEEKKMIFKVCLGIIYAPGTHQKTIGFLVISGGTKND